MSDPLIVGLLAGAVVIVVGLLVFFSIRRRRQVSIRDVLAAIALDRLDDVLVPDGMGGEIHCEHLLLTVHGILVINVKQYDGIIFASDRMDQWTAMGEAGRSTFRNPLPNLYDRVAAVKQLVRDIEVRGLVVFPARADFSKGCPADIILPEALAQQYVKPEKSEISRLHEAFLPHWESIREAVRPASA